MHDALSSPILQKFISSIPSQQSTLNFIDYIKKVGNPLVEPIQNTLDVLLTYIYIGDETTKNVVVIGNDFPSWDYKKNMMCLIPNTTIWFKSYIVKKDTQAVYRFSVNDPLNEDWNFRNNNLTLDPLNKKIWTQPNDDKYNVHTGYKMSYIDLENKQHTRFKKLTHSNGHIKQHELYSEIFNNNRRIWVYTPYNYDPTVEYALLFLFDGWNFANESILNLQDILDNLIANGEIEPFVAIMMENFRNPIRKFELPCNPKMSDFILNEIIPWATTLYSFTSDPERSIISGRSYGGLTSAYIAHKHPERFAKALCQSPSFWWKHQNDEEYEWLYKQYDQLPTQPISLYIEAGIYEDITPRQKGPNLLQANRNFIELLKKKNYKFHYEEYSGGHHNLSWSTSFAKALVMLTKM